MKNELRFSTKVNANGNSFKLLIDLKNKTYQAGYFVFQASESDVKISKKEIEKLVANLEESGFSRVSININEVIWTLKGV